MSLSLIGIIFVQGYWISESVATKKEQFAFSAKRALASVAISVQNRELEDYYYPLEKIIDSLEVPDDLTFDELFFIEEDPVSNEIFLYRNGILSQDFKVSAPVLENDLDSLEITRYYNRSSRQIIRRNGLDGNEAVSKDRTQEFSRLLDFEKYNYSKLINDVVRKVPVHKRVTEKEIRRLLTLELTKRDLDSNFEFAVFSNDLMTKVRSENFDIEEYAQLYKVPIFQDDEGMSNYFLYATFPGENRFVISSVSGMAGMSIIFTLIIIVAYASALLQLNRQRQISQIKTDFINNMTHEFKTPIATINLALDAVKNPKVSDNREKVAYYHRMIKEENKRMHAQVENVLRISKLEKNQLDIRKERYKLHDIIEDAVNHIQLIVEDRKGYVAIHLDAAKSSILANESHLTNVVVNILDNAVKYSPEEPKIDVYTENVKDFIFLKVKDRGEGMTKGAQRKVFEKFYREHTGNIHNVKGHGLGLAYAKQIIEDHQGEIFIESEKGKGSTFTIKLPLIS